MLARCQIWSKSEDSRAAIREKLEHLDRVAKIKVENLVGGKPVQLRKRPLLKQVVNCRPHGPHSTCQLHLNVGSVGPAIEAAFDRVRFQFQ